MALLTIEEAAAMLRVKVSWLYERTRTNDVPHLKLGKYLRFDEDELRAWTHQFRRDGHGRGASVPQDGVPAGTKRSRRGSTGGLKAHRS